MASMNFGYLRTYTSRIQACRQFLIGYQMLNCFSQQVEQFRICQCGSSFLPITYLVSSFQPTSYRYYHSELGNHSSSFMETVQLHGGTIDNFSSSSKGTEEKKLLKDLNHLNSNRDIFKFISSVENLSDKMVVAVFQRMCDVHLEGNLLKNTEDLMQNENFKSLCFQLEQESQTLSDSSLVDSLNALTKLGIDPCNTLIACLIAESQRRLEKGHMTIRNLCILGESLFNLEGSESAFLEKVMEKIQSISLEVWKVDEIAMVYKMLQLCADKAGKYQDLLNKMNTFTVTQVFQFSPKLTSIILNALVVLDQTEALCLVIKLGKHSVRQIPHFTNDEIISVLEAFVYFGYNDWFFTKALEQHVAEGAFIMHSSVVSKVMQYCSKKHVLSERIFNAVAESFIYNADNFTTAQIAEQIVPFGKLNYLPPCAPSLFRKLERILSTRFAQFQPRVLLNLLHSFILVERYPLNFLAKVFSPYFLQQLQAEESSLEKSVLSQLTQLYLAVRLECPSYKGPELFPQYRVKSFLTSDHSVESLVDGHFYKKVKAGLTDFLGTQKYFASKVLTPYCYTLDIEIKLDEEGFLLPSSTYEDVYKSIALCIDDQKRFCANSHHLLGKEAIKQRHLKLVGYDVVQIPFFEFELLRSRSDIVDYLHKKIFPNSYRLSW